MRFFIVRRSDGGGKPICECFIHKSHKDFVLRVMDNPVDIQYHGPRAEVPVSCVKRIYGTINWDKWENRPWPFPLPWEKQ